MLSIILKGTNGCNLACSYCSLGKKKKVVIATREILYKIMKYSCELCRHNLEKEVCFILHGGEPTLIDCSEYNYALQKIKGEYRDLVIEIMMQTNGYHITNEWMEFFKLNEVSVGISLDGSTAIHDKERKTINGEKTFSVIQKNVKLMQQQGIKVSCLMVLTSNALTQGYDYLEFFSRNNIHIKINPLLDYGEVYENPELSLKTGEYANYLIGMYEYIMEKNIDIGVSPIDKILQGILYNDKNIRECSFKKDCNLHFLCIDYKGDIYPCGKYSDMEQYYIGNIAEKNYEVFHSEVICRLLSRRNELMPGKCKKCKYISLCNAGCNAEACINGSLDKYPAMCEDYYKLFNYFMGQGLVLLKEALLKYKEKLKGVER